MKRVPTIIAGTVVNVAYVVVAFAGAVHGVAWAWNLTRFIVIASFVCIVLVTNSKTATDAARAHGRTFPAWAAWITDGLVISILAATGHFVFASLQLTETLLEKGLFTPIPTTNEPKP